MKCSHLVGTGLCSQELKAAVHTWIRLAQDGAQHHSLMEDGGGSSGGWTSS